MSKLGPLTVSRQGFGAMGLSSSYGKADDQESIRTLHRAVELGITLFDTATGYGGGHNEALLGRAIADRRNGLVIASKFVHRPGGAARVTAKEAVETSLKRLGLEVIDLYYLHRIDPDIPVEESVGELARQVEAGTIRAIGLSEASAAQLRRAHAVHPIGALQSEYSLWTRDVEAEILPAARELGVGFVAYSPLGRGFLAGAEVSDPADRRAQHPRFQPQAVAQNASRRARLEEIARSHGVSAAQLALAWVLSKGVVPIPGTRHVAHLEANWGANALWLSQVAQAELEQVFPPGSTVGDRYPAEALKLVPPAPFRADPVAHA